MQNTTKIEYDFGIKSDKKENDQCQKCFNEMKIQKHQPVIQDFEHKMCLLCIKKIQEHQEDTTLILFPKCSNAQELNVKIEEKSIQTYKYDNASNSDFIEL